MKPNVWIDWIAGVAALCAVAAFAVPGPARADSMYVTGAGAGGGPHVKVYRSSDNAAVGSFFAYASSVSTGVRVAICQQGTGTGARHVVFTAPGPGSPSHLRAFDAVSGAVIAETFAWPTNLVTGFYLACGDFFGDGGVGVAIAPDGGGGPHVKVFRLSGNSLALQREWFAYDASFRGGVRLAAGRFGANHDLLVTAPGPGGGPHLRRWEVSTQQEVAGAFAPVTDLQGLPFPAYSAGLFVTRLPDVSGDGQDDLAVSYTGRLVFRRPGQPTDGNPFIVSPNYSTTGVFVASGGIQILNGATFQLLSDYSTEACYTDASASQDYWWRSSVAELNAQGPYNLSFVPAQYGWTTPLPDRAPPIAGGTFAGGAFLLVGNRKGGLLPGDLKAYGPVLSYVESTPTSYNPLFPPGLIGYSRPCVPSSWRTSPYGAFASEIYVSAD